MSFITVNNARIYYQSVGQGTETIVFSHGYLMDNTMFDGQIEVLKNHFRCISFDHRGHGKSEVTKEGYQLNNLVDDAIALIEELNLGAVHFVGMSTGGFVGMRIALRRPDLLKSLVLMDTSAEAESDSALRQYKILLWVAKYFGWFAVIDQVMPKLFHTTFLNDPSRSDEVKKWRNIITSHDRKGVVPFGKGIFSRKSVSNQLPNIKIPTTVIVGSEDVATTPGQNKRLAQAISGATFHLIPDAGHSAAVEKPKKVLEAMQSFYRKSGFLIMV